MGNLCFLWILCEIYSCFHTDYFFSHRIHRICRRLRHDLHYDKEKRKGKKQFSVFPFPFSVYIVFYSAIMLNSAPLAKS